MFVILLFLTLISYLQHSWGIGSGGGVVTISSKKMKKKKLERLRYYTKQLKYIKMCIRLISVLDCVHFNYRNELLTPYTVN